MQVFIDEYLITAVDLWTIAQGGTPPSVAALAQLKERCKLVWVAVSPVTDNYRGRGELCDLDTLQAALSRAGYQPSVLRHVMRNSDNIRAATTVQAASEYIGYYKPVSVRGWPESGSSTVVGERPKCRLIKDEEWSWDAVASAVDQFLAIHSRCVVLCRYHEVTKLSAALSALPCPHLLYTGQQQQQGAVERWLEGEGEGVLVTTTALFRGCEAQAVVQVTRCGRRMLLRTAATRAVAALLLITSDERIDCDQVYNYFEKF